MAEGPEFGGRSDPPPRGVKVRIRIRDCGGSLVVGDGADHLLEGRFGVAGVRAGEATGHLDVAVPAGQVAKHEQVFLTAAADGAAVGQGSGFGEDRWPVGHRGVGGRGPVRRVGAVEATECDQNSVRRE